MLNKSMAISAENIDSLTITPVKSFKGELTVPGDKSISHRAVMLGSIAEGETHITGLLESDDTRATIAAFRLMGIEIEDGGDGDLLITGRGLRGLTQPASQIDCANSGTTARLLTGLLAPQGFTSRLTGDASLTKRPMKRVIEPLSMMGAEITGTTGPGGPGDEVTLPLTIKGSPLKGITYKTPVASAQLKSALLLAALYAEGRTIIDEPALSRDHTERMLRRFGYDVGVNDLGTGVTIDGKGSLKGCSIDVPGDISSAAFFMVAAAITSGSEILIKNVCINPTRCGIISILQRMGASIELLSASDDTEPVADIRVESSKLRGIEIDGLELLSAIDEFPILCVAASFAEGVTTITGAGELRVKESDRISAMAEALASVGVKVEELPEGIVVHGMDAGMKEIKGGTVQSRSDHRVAMAMAMAGLGSSEGVTIEGPGCVNVSFPGFFELIDELAIR